MLSTLIIMCMIYKSIAEVAEEIKDCQEVCFNLQLNSVQRNGIQQSAKEGASMKSFLSLLLSKDI